VPGGINSMDDSMLPCFAAGNVFTQGTQSSKFDAASVRATDFAAGAALTQKSDGWYLTLAADPAWREEAGCKLVTTKLLGTAKVSGCAYENTDASPLTIDTDFLGKKRNKNNPFPGPFENMGKGEHEIKVWPLPKPGQR
ncbi:MAG TPA: hypothetical protein VK742_03825, partial [Candidatus Sulfotelmatobacter sp.]|nr:hypothetical protein [Candidatus Sulfotelmatobacter sp.]